MEIVNSGALMALVSFLQDSDPNASSDLLVPAFLALIRLSADSLLAQELSRLNLEEILIPVLAQTDPRLQTAACLTLGNLALEPTLVDTVSSPQIVHAVLSVLNSRHEAIKRVAITCLANIATYAQGRHRIVEQDGVQLISELLDDEYSDQLRGEAAFSLGNILSGRDINLQDKIRESGVLPSLVLLLSPIFAEDINSSSAWGLYHAVRLNAASQSIVADSGGLGMLVQHIRSGTLESLKTNALLALESVVVKNEKNLAWCRTNGVLKLIHEIDRDELNVNAKQALTSLLEHLI
ncbi:hypothetical protein PsorP6_016709 [Peronosclerospora sorghi]|uniref:Uncharacterized protein n=1 Tax=Peronosclerospora sorghi TaxID=230839 RepID=A0ACC0WBM3_9STRA|nr:hypothetical protein PsorP6_016709 [Peronosclerospora sorghi]